MIDESDYKGAAQAFLKSADEYYHISTFLWNKPFVAQHMAVLTNVAFACELYIKAFLLSNQIDYTDCAVLAFRKKHDLYPLFQLLPREIKEDIQSNVRIKNFDECLTSEQTDSLSNSGLETFDDYLVSANEAFIVLRYGAEYETMAFKPGFLYDLMEALHQKSNDRCL